MSGPKPQDITGQKFGRLTAVKRIGKTKGRVSIWECVCECGNEHQAIISQLRNGDIKSCGCIKKVDSPVAKERLFRIWSGMRQRCNNPNDRAYKYYGGRGISICGEWIKYKNFREWALKSGYDDTLTIDRENNNGNYTPGNCRWIDNQTQQSNKRSNVFIQYRGDEITLTELSRRTGLSVPMLHRRYRAGYRGEELWEMKHLQTGEEINALKYKVKVDIASGSQQNF